jgi:hypothetical protein
MDRRQNIKVKHSNLPEIVPIDLTLGGELATTQAYNVVGGLA